MTALTRLQPQPLTQPTPASRKDLLGVGHNPGLTPMTANAAGTWLHGLGFESRQVSPGHWIVTHSKALPELHFYSVSELGQFAAYRAHRYAATFKREES